MTVEETEHAGVTTISIVGPAEVSGQETSPKCATCRFYAENYREDDRSYGQCRRRAPVRADMSVGWPGVSSDLWCGEYEPSLTPTPDRVA